MLWSLDNYPYLKITGNSCTGICFDVRPLGRSLLVGPLSVLESGFPNYWIQDIACILVVRYYIYCNPTRYHTIACSCARTLIYWSVFQSTIVRLFACYTERNVNQCILNGSVLRQLTCSTKRYERERKREREGQRERERERARERLQKGCAQIVQCTLVMFMPKPIYIIRLWKLQ